MSVSPGPGIGSIDPGAVPFSVTERDTSGGITLEATARGETGEIFIDVDVSSPSFIPISPEIATAQQTIRVRPTGLVSFKNSVRRLPGRISRQTGISTSFLRSTIQPQYPSPDRFSFSETISGGEVLPVSFTFGPIEFPPTPVPDTGNFTENLPTVTLTVEDVATGFFSSLTADLPSVDLELPPEAFVTPTNVRSAGCGELFPDIQTELDRIQQRMANVDQIEEDLNELLDIGSSVLNNANESRLSEVSPSDISGVGRERVDEWRQTVNQADPSPISGFASIGGLLSDARSLQNRVENLDVPRCRSQFQSSVNSLVDRLEGLNEQADQLREQKRLLSSILGNVTAQIPDCVDQTFDSVRGGRDIQGSTIQHRIDTLSSQDPSEISIDTVEGLISDIQSIPTDTPGNCRQVFISQARDLRSRVLQASQQLPDIGCGDVPRFVRNSVASAQQGARQFTRARPVSRTQGRFQRILEEIEDSRDLVQDEVADDNPCKDQLLGRLDQAESNLRGAGVAEGAVSCDAKYPSIDDRITAFEEDAIAIDPPVDAESFELFASRADNIISNIEGNIPESDERCRRQFVRRTEGALDRIADVGARTRVVTDLTSEQIQRRQEVIDELRSRVGDIAPRRRGTLFG